MKNPQHMEESKLCWSKLGQRNYKKLGEFSSATLLAKQILSADLSGLPFIHHRPAVTLAMWVATPPAALTRTEIASYSRAGPGTFFFGLWRQIQIATGLSPLRFVNHKPNPPLYLWWSELPKSQPAGRNRRIITRRLWQKSEGKFFEQGPGEFCRGFFRWFLSDLL